MPKCKAGWSRIRVRARQGAKQFVHGSRAFSKIRADSFPPGMSVHVFRGDAFYDLGKTLAMPEGVRFGGLQVIAPESEREFRDPPQHPGVVAVLAAGYFEAGDELHLSLFPAEFRSRTASQSSRAR